jgi:transposase
VRAKGRFGTDKVGYQQMLAAGREFADRAWGVEAGNGIGKHIAHRLVHDGETVLDVPPKLSARVRVFATGNGRKTDPVDAHSVAMVALRTPGLVQVEVEASVPQIWGSGIATGANQRRNFESKGYWFESSRGSAGTLNH